MNLNIFNGIEIMGISCAVPKNKIDNREYLLARGNNNPDKLIKIIGIKERYFCNDNQCTSDLCFVAAKRLLAHLNWEPDTVDALFFITQTPDYRRPATACVLQHRLGLSTKCISFDINLGCSGYTYGIWLAASVLSASNMKRVLLLAGDIEITHGRSDYMPPNVLFGDAGSATAIERNENGEIAVSLGTDGSGFRKIITPVGFARNRTSRYIEPYLHNDGETWSDYDMHMNGSEVFNFSITTVPDAIEEHILAANIEKSHIDYYIIHQANLFIIQNIIRKIGVSIDKVPISIDKFGNTNSASIPLTMCDAFSNREWTNKLNIIMAGFGIGLSWGVVSALINPNVCLPVVFTDEYFDDGVVIKHD